MKYLSNLGQRANRLTIPLLRAVALTLILVSPAAAPPLAQAAGLNPSTDACSLVTQQEAGMALGADPGAGEVDTRQDASACTYGTMPGIVMVNVLSPGGQADYDHLLGLAKPGEVFDVAGVGDGAFGVSAGPTASIWFYKGDTLVAINVMAGLTPPPPTDMAIMLAKAAASRI
ncbi:MAG: hypothetical protein ACR2IK_16085 [Chloroflexota bacterium]